MLCFCFVVYWNPTKGARDSFSAGFPFNHQPTACVGPPVLGVIAPHGPKSMPRYFCLGGGFDPVDNDIQSVFLQFVNRLFPCGYTHCLVVVHPVYCADSCTLIVLC